MQHYNTTLQSTLKLMNQSPSMRTRCRIPWLQPCSCRPKAPGWHPRPRYAHRATAPADAALSASCPPPVCAQAQPAFGMTSCCRCARPTASQTIGGHASFHKTKGSMRVLPGSDLQVRVEQFVTAGVQWHSAKFATCSITSTHTNILQASYIHCLRCHTASGKKETLLFSI